MDCRTNGLYGSLTFVTAAIHPAAIQYVCRTNGLSDQWIVGPVDCRTSGLADQWTVPVVDTSLSSRHEAFAPYWDNAGLTS